MRRPTFFEPSSPGSAVLHVGPRNRADPRTISRPCQGDRGASIKDVSFSVPVDTSLDTSRFSSEVGN